MEAMSRAFGLPSLWGPSPSSLFADLPALGAAAAELPAAAKSLAVDIKDTGARPGGRCGACRGGALPDARGCAAPAAGLPATRPGAQRLLPPSAPLLQAASW